MQKIGIGIDKLALNISAFAIGLAAIVVILQVFVRYALSFSFPWGDELSRMLMIWGCFIGASSVVKRGQLASVNLFGKYLSHKKTLILNIIINLIGLIFLVLVMYSAIKQMTSPTFLMQQSPAMRLPMFWPYLAVPLGCLFMTWHLFEDNVVKISQLRGD